MKVGGILLITVTALLACGCASSTPLSPSTPEGLGEGAPSTAGAGMSSGAPAPAAPAAESQARPRGRSYPKEELRRVARVASARCKKANASSDSSCLLNEAAPFLKFRPEDPDCRYVSGTAISVAECSDFNEGCQSVDAKDLDHQIAALQNAGKDCNREPTDFEREEVLKLVGSR
ncbi:MAG TPA: hypothetical protein VL242_53180 [Sorangium sp.]|uniref:hypothetical protein n=1 Tax=Sorangium sp. So ce1153 TaxID=3133333 RepID=UPI002D02E3B7|nr:hypothetical protein [Sorangium sp.]